MAHTGHWRCRPAHEAIGCRVTCGALCRCLGVLLPLANAMAASAALPAEADTTEAPRAGLSLLSPTDRGLRSDLAWLVDRGVINVPLGTWPVPSTVLEASWRNVNEKSLDAVDADALARVQRALHRSTDTARLNVQVNSAHHPSLDGGDAALGTAEVSLSVYAGSANLAGQLTLGATFDNLDGSYIAGLLPGTLISFGVVGRWWGPGQFTSPIFSTAAQPIPGILIRRSDDSAPETSWLAWVGPWGYEISAGQLQHYTPAGTRTLGLRLYLRPLPNFELGFSRSMLWGGEGRPTGFDAFKRVLRGETNIDDPATQGADPSDEIAGFDLRLSGTDPWGTTWVGYGHAVGEDGAGGLPSKYIATVGLQAKGLVGRNRLEATFEATDTAIGRMFGLGHDSSGNVVPAYTHNAWVDGYYQRQLPIGANIGGAGIINTLGFAWTPIDDPNLRRLYAALWQGRVSQSGPQSINASFGTPGNLYGGSLSLEGETPQQLKWQVGLSVQRYSADVRPTTGVTASISVPLQTGR